MQFTYSPYILPLIASAVISAWMAVYVWPRRTSAPGATALTALAAAVAVWCVGYALEIAGADLPTKVFWGKSQYLGIASIPLLWVIFACRHSGLDAWIKPRNLSLLAIIPLVTLILAFTTELHGLVWKDVRVETLGAFSALNIMHGPWFWIYWAYSNILIFIGTFVLLRFMGWLQGLARRQNTALLVAVLAPWIGNALYALDLSPIPHLDITPFAFTFSVVATTWSIIGFRLVAISPVARGLVVEEMNDGMIVLDTRGRVADINRSAQAILKLPSSRAVGKKAMELLADSSWAALFERYGNALDAQDEIALGEGESQTWYELRLAPLIDARERLLGRVITMRNITDRQRAENLLRESETRYRQLIENASDIIYRTDFNGNFIYANPVALSIMGFTSMEEVIGRHFLDLVLPAWRPRLRRFYEHQFVAGAPNTYMEFPAVATDGREIWLGQNVQVIRANDRIVGFQAVARDITARRQAEEQIRQLSRAVEASPASIVITDSKGDIQYVNPKFSEVTGYAREDVLGRNPRILKSDVTPPQTHQDLWETLSGKREWVGEFCNRKKNGELFWELASISPITDELGNVTHYVAVKENITERKQFEQQLAVARDQALESSRLKGQFLAKMSHEFRTPLGGILGYAELFLSGAFGALDDEQRTAIRNIIDSARYLSGMVNELLDEAQIESNTIRLHPEPFALGALLERIRSSMAVLAESKGLRIVTTISPDLPEVLVGDEKRLQQVLINLVGNAIKFTSVGEIRLDVLRPNATHWAMRVSDTGIGIPESAQAYVFDSFRQVNASLAGDHRGTGLGLSIARQLVELMGGQISLESEIGRGSTFTVLLPIIEQEDSHE